MKPKIKTQWVTALRSGEYEQGRSALKTEDGKYCCLGVLADLAVKAGVIESGPCSVCNDGDEPSKGHIVFDGQSGFPTDRVMEWAGLDAQDPTVPVRDDEDDMEATTLANLNDQGVPFSEIADLIEAHL